MQAAGEGPGFTRELPGFAAEIKRVFQGAGALDQRRDAEARAKAMRGILETRQD